MASFIGLDSSQRSDGRGRSEVEARGGNFSSSNFSPQALEFELDSLRESWTLPPLSDEQTNQLSLLQLAYKHYDSMLLIEIYQVQLNAARQGPALLGFTAP
jgi:hypothetical protein